MFEIIQSGGWVMAPILLCSVIATAIIGERFWSLQKSRICPGDLVTKIWQWVKNNQLDASRITSLRSSSPLGRILAAGLANQHHDREIMKESIEETGRHVVMELERYLNTLGTIASVSPLLGLYGTVLGMIEVFTVMTTVGVGNHAALAGGIAKALITTAAGLTVAIPALMFYRYFRGKVESLVITMEKEALKMVEILQGDREMDSEKRSS